MRSLIVLRKSKATVERRGCARHGRKIIGRWSDPVRRHDHSTGIDADALCTSLASMRLDDRAIGLVVTRPSTETSSSVLGLTVRRPRQADTGRLLPGA